MIFKVSFGTSDIRFYGSSTRTEQRVGSLSPRSRVRHVLLRVSLLNPPSGSRASLALVGRGPASSPCTGLFPLPAVCSSARGHRGLWLQQSVGSALPRHGRLFPAPQAPASTSLHNSSTSDFPGHFPLCESLACDVQNSGLSFGFAPNTKFSLFLKACLF